LSAMSYMMGCLVLGSSLRTPFLWGAQQWGWPRGQWARSVCPAVSWPASPPRARARQSQAGGTRAGQSQAGVARARQSQAGGARARQSQAGGARARQSQAPEPGSMRPVEEAGNHMTGRTGGSMQHALCSVPCMNCEGARQCRQQVGTAFCCLPHVPAACSRNMGEAAINIAAYLLPALPHASTGRAGQGRAALPLHATLACSRHCRW